MKRYSLAQKSAFAGMRMVVPAVIILGVFVLYPIVQSFWMSLNDWNILQNKKGFIGGGNYLKAISDERFVNALKNTVIFTLTYVPLLVITSLLTAAFISYRFYGSGVFKVLLFLPAITSMAIVAVIFKFLLDGDIGIISFWFRGLGIPVRDFLRDPDTAMGAVVLVGLWRSMGFNMVIFLAGLNAIPESLYEAAGIDGANRFRQFFHISLPLLIPTTSFVLITNIIGSFQVFDQIYVMTKGGPVFATEVLVYYIYYRGFTVFDMGYASSIAFILFCIILIITIFNLGHFGKGEQHGEYEG
jgi:multiple sugar transport system permease protein